MAYTYSKIATYTVGSGGVPSVSFLNIPQNYKDLVLKVSARSNAARTNEDLLVSFNSSTSNRSWKFAEGYGNGYTSSSGTDGRFSTFNAASTTANAFGSAELYISNYTSPNPKVVSVDTVTEDNATQAYAEIARGLWSSGDAINSITLTLAFGTLFNQYSSFHLYGIKAEI
jgi:hypothetical protein